MPGPSLAASDHSERIRRVLAPAISAVTPSSDPHQERLTRTCGGACRVALVGVRAGALGLDYIDVSLHAMKA